LVPFRLSVIVIGWKWSCIAKIASARSLCSAMIGGLVTQGLPLPRHSAQQTLTSQRAVTAQHRRLGVGVLPLLAAIDLALGEWLGEISH
jgi:hypothetical protein